jgi:hypothetical protein
MAAPICATSRTDAKPVEPRQQRGVQGRRDGEWRQRAVEHIVVRLLAQQVALQDTWSIPRRTAARRAARSTIWSMTSQAMSCRRRSAQPMRSGAPVQAIERQHADLRLAGPGRLELRAERYDQQHRQAAYMLDGEVEQLARGRVDPLRILKTITNGCWRAKPSSCRSSDSSVLSFLRCD